VTEELACYILKNGHELKCELKDVKEGDHFRMADEATWSVADDDAVLDAQGAWYVVRAESMEKSGPTEIPLEDTVTEPSDNFSIRVTRRDGTTDVVKS